MIRWGLCGRRQRWRCQDCKKTGIQNKKLREDQHTYFKYFKIWVTTQTPLHALEKLTGVSSKTLQRHFDRFIFALPKIPTLAKTQEIWLKVDGTYFGNWGCLIVYKAGKDILYWQYAEREYYAVYEAGLKWLQESGYIILGVTSDWHSSIVSTVERVFPDIPHQRCSIHTQRLCQSLLTRNPQTEAGWMLLRIIRELNSISNEYQKIIWLRWFGAWEKRYGNLIKERAYSKKPDGSQTWWYIHKNLRRAFRTLLSTQEHLFLYLDHTGLEKDTNGLEAEFKHLKAKIGSHAGLRREERMAYISWYLFFKSH